MWHSYHISQVRTSGRDRICSSNTVRNDHSVLELQPLAATQTLCLVKFKDAPQLSLWPVCSLSQVWAKHSSEWWGSPTLSYQEKKCRVTGYFPGTQGGESVSISPWPFSGPNGGQLHHYLLPVTSLLGNLYSIAASLFFHLSAYPSDTFYPARTEYHPPLSRRSYSRSSSIFSSAVYTDLSVSIAPLQMCN